MLIQNITMLIKNITMIIQNITMLLKYITMAIKHMTMFIQIKQLTKFAVSMNTDDTAILEYTLFCVHSIQL